MKKVVIVVFLLAICIAGCVGETGNVVGSPVVVSGHISYVLVHKTDGQVVEAIVPIGKSFKQNQSVRVKLLDQPVKANNLVIIYYAEDDRFKKGVVIIVVIIGFIVMMLFLLPLIGGGSGSKGPYVGGIAGACASGRSGGR